VTNPRPHRVAFQGGLGAYAEDAVQLLYGTAAEAVPHASHVDALIAVRDGTADRALLPIENTITGSIGESHDAIDRTPGVVAVQETIVAIHHCLLAPHGASVSTVTTVLSHPIVIAQCQDFFAKHPRIQTHGLYDSESAAREVAQLGDPSFGALAAAPAARRNGLAILLTDIGDRRDNQTRFLAFAREAAMPPAGTAVRTMIVFTTKDTPGSLLAALQPFASYGVNLRRIDTRPTGEPWSYRFFVELDHEFGNVKADAAMRAVARASAGLRFVGTFPRWDTARRGSIGWSPTDTPVIA
jgi:prephenate dehydratase